VAEGDTIHRTRARLAETLEGRRIRRAEAPNPRSGLGRHVEQLRGRTLERVEARGKNLLLHFSDDLVLHSHLGMNGGWHVYPARARWRRARAAAWLVLSTKAADAVQFGGPTLALMREAELARHPRLARLGPDILAPGFEVRRGAEALRGAGPERELGDALLDQRLISGVGNVFKSEGCFAAELDPWRRIGDLGDDELTRAIAETEALMRAGLEGRRSERQVYKRAKLPCPRCGAPLRARRQGDDARTTYWCGRCQR
jgi:endonuclease VIII